MKGRRREERALKLADLNFFSFFPELAAKNLEKHVTGNLFIASE